MFITTMHGITEHSVRLEDVESFVSVERYNSGCEVVMHMKYREEFDDSIRISYMMVHDEDGNFVYEKVENLAHLTRMIEKEKDYYTRKELF